jgi:hypothetical protein
MVGSGPFHEWFVHLVPRPRLRTALQVPLRTGRDVDVRLNWKEQPMRPSLTGKVWR